MGETETSRSASDTQTSAPKRAESPESDPGVTLIETAKNLAADRSWKKAIKALTAAQMINPDNRELDLLMLEFATNARDSKRMKVAKLKLGHRLERTTEGLLASAASAVALGNWGLADTSARSALQMDPSNPRGWTLLAASYAGLGWFDECNECLDGATRYGQASELDLYYVGRSTNHWARYQSPALLAGLVASLLAGFIIGLSVAILTPYIAREFRVKTLDPRITELANKAYTDTYRTRLLASVASLSLVAVYITIATVQ